eukprot:NODE_4270_length_1912_cov_3.858824.p1 GENE.NODE_4270_length_1912_cov_3.858824~~NODE_4270_length_1912_cov_3.858824.p1  ORF type:complete len:523 (-),score=155.87 NODE_4270_length_1912_cov_3.858824:166-1734(-)
MEGIASTPVMSGALLSGTPLEIADVRFVALPCVLLAGFCQYVHFAKKPMAAPCQRLSEHCARRLVILGLFAELATLWLMPVSAAYPMNASCLVFLYFWKESKRFKSVHFNELVACASALSAWLLPFIDPSADRAPAAMEPAELLGTALSPDTCVYVGVLLFGGVVLHCLDKGTSPRWSCAPAAMNFGVTVLLLKAFRHIAAAAVASPDQPIIWLVLAADIVLLLLTRSAATVPLRCAMELYETLTVLAVYGVMSSGMAALTGIVVFGELRTWDSDRLTAYAAIAVAHCWGMHSIGQRGQESRCHTSADDDETMDAVEMGFIAGGASRQVDRSSVIGNSTERTVATSSSSSSRGKAPPSPLLKIQDAPKPRSVDEDARFEEELFARALAPRSLNVGLSSACASAAADDVDGGWATAWPADAAFGDAPFDPGAGVLPVGAPPQFDADFEEMMRRFHEDDHQSKAPIVSDTNVPTQSSPAMPTVEASMPPAILTSLDAQTLLDVSYGGLEDEDELFKTIEDIPGP